ncbi:MAG: ATP phosphoribosyltransferase, partial [Spirochaetota bacterium]
MMPVKISTSPLSLALPKGRLLEEAQKLFSEKDINFEFSERKLVTQDEHNTLRIFLVKNNDLPTYVNHGIAG